MKRRPLPQRSSPSKASEASRKGSGNARSATRSVSPPAGASDHVAPPGAPPNWLRATLSIWLPLHLLALAISLTSVVEPSSLQSQLQGILRPYVQLSHFGADDRPLYLAYGESSEQTHRLQVSRGPFDSVEALTDEANWTDLHFPGGEVASIRGPINIVHGPAATPGLAVSDRYSRWLSTAATLAENEQPSLVAELLIPTIRGDESIRAVRIVRLPNDLSSTVAEDAIIYVGAVVRRQDRIEMLQLQPQRLSATATSGVGAESDE